MSPPPPLGYDGGMEENPYESPHAKSGESRQDSAWAASPRTILRAAMIVVTMLVVFGLPLIGIFFAIVSAIFHD